MRRKEPRWARYARAAVAPVKKPLPGAGTEAEVGHTRVPNPQVAPAARQRHRFPAIVPSLVNRLADDPGRPTPVQSPPRPDIRLVPAVAVTWAGAGVAIGLPWNQSAAGAVACLLAVLVTALLLWRGRNRCRDRVSDADMDRDRGELAPEAPEAPAAPMATAAPVAAGSAGSAGPVGSWLAGAIATALLAAACLGTVLFGVALRQYDNEHAPLAVAAAQGRQMGMTIMLSSAPQPLDSAQGPRQVIFAAVVLRATAGGRLMTGKLPVTVIAGVPWEPVPEGALVDTAGVIRPAGLRDNVAGYLRPATPPLEIHAAAGSPAQVIRDSWVRACRRVWAATSADTAALLPGMVMGDRSSVAPELGQPMKTVGLTHLTAVSGANCTLVLAALALGLRTMRMPRFPAGGLAVLGLMGFVSVVGPDASVLRAAVMGGIGTLAMLGGRPKRVGALLGASIVVLLVADPWLAVDFAFILSVLATLGLHLVGQRCARWLGVWLPGWLAQAVAIPLSAQLFCAPVIVLLQPRLTPYTVPANMAAAPVVALVTTVGTLGMAVAPLAPVVAQWCAAVSGSGAWWVAVVARWMSGLPAASLPWPEGAPGAILMALLDAAVLCALVVMVEHRRLAVAVQRLKGRAPPGLRRFLGFAPMTGCAAVAAALWTAAVVGR